MKDVVGLEPKAALRQARATARAIRDYWARSGQFAGGQQTISQKGEGIQWADIRLYSYGDDVKSISWKHSSRSQETWIKTFEVERAHRFVLLLDRSGSMVSGVLQNRYHRAWWVTSVIAYLVLKQKDLCAVFQSDAKVARSQMQYVRNDSAVTQWAFERFNVFRSGINPDPLHVQISKLARVLRRHTSILVFSDGYDDFEALRQVLKPVCRSHEVKFVLFPDLFHISESFCRSAHKYHWRFLCVDPEDRTTFVARMDHLRKEWHHFWSSLLRMGHASVEICGPEEDAVVFVRRLLRQ